LTKKIVKLYKLLIYEDLYSVVFPDFDYIYIKANNIEQALFFAQDELANALLMNKRNRLTPYPSNINSIDKNDVMKYLKTKEQVDLTQSFTTMILVDLSVYHN
jgi:hypothetical protein